MKSLKEILEASILADIDDQLEAGDEALKSVIIKWIKNNAEITIRENKFKFDFNTTPITVDYDGIINFKNDITSLTNENFQWGEVTYFDCSHCKSLKSLEGSPKVVKDVFSCSFCKSLKSLKGAPEEVGRYFNCSECNLESLEGAPEEVGGTFNCQGCYLLKSLEGAPKKVGGDFKCKDCGLTFTKDDVKKICKVKGKIKWQ